MSVSAAKSRLMQAKMNLESGRTDEVEPLVQAALKFLEGLPEAETAAVRADLMKVQAAVASLPTPEDLRNITGAKGKLRQARSQIESKQLSGIDDTLATADRFLAGVPDAHKAELVAEIAAVRAQLGSAAPAPAAVRSVVAAPERASGAAPAPSAAARPAPAPAAAAPAPAKPIAAAPPAAAAALSDDDHANLSRAKSRVNQAKTLLETGRTENIESILEAAAGFLDQVPASASAALRAEIANVRAQTGGAVAGELTRRVTDELERHLSSAKSDIEHFNVRTCRDSLARAEARFNDDEVKKAIAPDALAAMKKQAAELRLGLAAAIRADALQRALPLVDELEKGVVTDPFAGKDQHEAYLATNALESLKIRIRGALRPVPDGDAEVAAIERRIIAVDQKIDKASAAWGKARLDASVSNTWSFIAKDIEGWEQETVSATAQPLDGPDLQKTSRAVYRIRFLLDDAETKRIRAENKGDATIEATYANAERIFAAAAVKLRDAYNRAIDPAEKLETPMSRFVLDRPGLFAHSAESALQGTGYAEAVAARARALDARWKSEVAAIMKARQELFDKLAAEAEVAWPAIRDRIGAVEFDPATAARGTILRFDQVRNRCGWDWGSREYSFACQREETVLAGVFAPHVLTALEHAWYEQKLDVSDRLYWDVIAVVGGPGRIGERTEVIIRDKFTNFELGKVEEWPLRDCLKIEIIALHAGPVAVGP